ncbi:MAG: sulfotransferase [Alphaproteobacteria bacterium]|nr:sulfotransferase [Alphaproteobacteria bacterium]
MSLFRRPDRRIHIFGAGPPKSGTHSIEAIFKGHYRAKHEPKRARIIETVLAEAFGWISPAEKAELFLKIQETLNLEVNSSHHNVHFIETIVDAFPEAKVILTLRDAYSWVDSHINHEINRVADLRLTALRDFRFGAKAYRHPPEERVLEERGNFTLRGYLGYWAWSYQHIIDTVPPERLMVIRLDELKTALPRLAEFAQVSPATLQEEKTHQFKGLGRHGLLKQIDRDYLEDLFAEYAGPLMQRYFPDIPSLDHARV